MQSYSILNILFQLFQNIPMCYTCIFKLAQEFLTRRFSSLIYIPINMKYPIYAYKGITNSDPRSSLKDHLRQFILKSGQAVF